jgi:hypothetical protein
MSSAGSSCASAVVRRATDSTGYSEHAPHVPPCFAQYLQLRQLWHALQGLAPTHVAAAVAQQLAAAAGRPVSAAAPTIPPRPTVTVVASASNAPRMGTSSRKKTIKPRNARKAFGLRYTPFSTRVSSTPLSVRIRETTSFVSPFPRSITCTSWCRMCRHSRWFLATNVALRTQCGRPYCSGLSSRLRARRKGCAVEITVERYSSPACTVLTDAMPSRGAGYSVSNPSVDPVAAGS